MTHMRHGLQDLPSGALRKISPKSRGSLGLDARELYYLRPLLSFFLGDEPGKVGGRAHERHASRYEEARDAPRRAVECNPRYSISYSLLAAALIRLGDRVKRSLPRSGRLRSIRL